MSEAHTSSVARRFPAVAQARDLNGSACRACHLTTIPHGASGHMLVLFRDGSAVARTGKAAR